MTEDAADGAKAAVESMLRAYYDAIIEEPLPPRLLLTLSVLARLSLDGENLDRVCVFIPPTRDHQRL